MKIKKWKKLKIGVDKIWKEDYNKKQLKHF